jgi:hypothetical protein
MWAAEGINPDMIKILISKGSEINARDDEGWTALMQASFSGQLENVSLLLESGADINSLSNKGETALAIAQRESHSEVVKLLQQRGTKK